MKAKKGSKAKPAKSETKKKSLMERLVPSDRGPECVLVCGDWALVAQRVVHRLGIKETGHVYVSTRPTKDSEKGQCINAMITDALLKKGASLKNPQHKKRIKKGVEAGVRAAFKAWWRLVGQGNGPINGRDICLQLEGLAGFGETMLEIDFSTDEAQQVVKQLEDLVAAHPEVEWKTPESDNALWKALAESEPKGVAEKALKRTRAAMDGKAGADERINAAWHAGRLYAEAFASARLLDDVYRGVLFNQRDAAKQPRKRKSNDLYELLWTRNVIPKYLEQRKSPTSSGFVTWLKGECNRPERDLWGIEWDRELGVFRETSEREGVKSETLRRKGKSLFERALIKTGF